MSGLPVTEKPLPEGLHPSIYIANWIFFSNATILFNKWLIDTAGFKYPILLTSWHLIFATLATQILARTTSLLTSRHSIPLTPRLYFRTILPIGLLYSGSLVCSNVVYLYLSVPFIQMLKSASPVAVLFVSWAWRVKEPALGDFLNILLIVAGVAAASAGEVHFSFVGFLYQLGGIVFEALRLVMIQIMLSGEGLNMSPLVGLYYYAPVCAVMNVAIAYVTEIPNFKMEDLWNTGVGMLFANACLAFVLNIASVMLIGKTSGLVMTLTGIFKNILLIIAAIVIWGNTIPPLQASGYSVAVVGLAYYSLGREQCLQLFRTCVSWGGSVWNDDSGDGKLSRSSRRGIVASAGVMAVLFVTIACFSTFTTVGSSVRPPGLSS